MRKSIAVLCALIICSSGGCKQEQQKNDDEYSHIAEYYVYDADYNHSVAITAGQGAELFTVEYTENSLALIHYDENGNIVTENSIDYNAVYDLYYADNILYIGYSGINGVSVDKIDLVTGENQFICNFPKLSDLRSISVIGEEVIAVGTDITKSDLNCAYTANMYSSVDYKGRGIYSFKSSEISEIVTDFPFEAECFDDTLII